MEYIKKNWIKIGIIVGVILTLVLIIVLAVTLSNTEESDRIDTYTITNADDPNTGEEAIPEVNDDITLYLEVNWDDNSYKFHYESSHTIYYNYDDNNENGGYIDDGFDEEADLNNGKVYFSELTEDDLVSTNDEFVTTQHPTKEIRFGDSIPLGTGGHDYIFTDTNEDGIHETPNESSNLDKGIMDIIIDFDQETVTSNDGYVFLPNS